jgi:hypothetical protein
VLRKVFLHIPGYQSKYDMPAQTAANLETEIHKLTDAHNMRLEKIQSQIVLEEKVAAEKVFPSERDPHLEAAKRLRDDLEKENQTFPSKVNSIRGMSN